MPSNRFPPGDFLRLYIKAVLNYGHFTEGSIVDDSYLIVFL